MAENSENQETEFIPLTNDLLFHMVFSKNADALKGLLSSLLNIPEEDIQRIEILNPLQYSDMADTKLTVLDLKVHLNDERFVIVEMQVRRFGFWINRTLVYACRQVADQAHGDFDYSKLEQVIQISIMDHTLFQDHKRFFVDYVPRDAEGYVYTDKLKFYVMDLTAIELATDEQKKQGVVEWAEAFKADSWEEVREIDNTGVKEAAKTMQLIMSNPTERDLVRARRDAQFDHRTQIRAAETRGEKKQAIASARRMKAKGYPLSDIMEVTGLSASEVATL